MSASSDQRENRELASEMKFLVPLSVADQVRDWARARLAPDPHSSAELHDGYHTTSLYFETAGFDVFNRRGSFGRSKYRIRRYGSSDAVFLERKLKTRGLVSKRRTVVSVNEVPQLRNGNPEPGWPGYWYHRRLAARRLQPVCQIDYQRTARVSMTDYGPIRLTIDTDARAHAINNVAFIDANGTPLLKHSAIVEMKYRYQMPTLFKLLIEEFTISARALSKYRMAALALGLASIPDSEAGGMHPSLIYA